MSVPFSRLNIQIRPRGQRGELDENEKWWAERQKALEQAGYMLRPRYHSERKFSWAGTDKSYLDFEDGQPQAVSVVIFDRRPIASTTLSTVWFWMRPGSLMGNM
jgi:hypothetical protein